MPTVPTRRISGGSNPYHANYVDTGTWTVGAEATNVITVSLQLKDSDGANLATPSVVTIYLSGVAAATAIVGTAPTGGVAVTVGSTLLVEVAGKMLKVVSTAAGLVTITLTDTGTPTFYAAAVMPDGSILVSGAITFA